MFQANNNFPTEEGRREVNPIQPIPTQNFINPDEALFSSANYPRDEFGRKILPGQQMEKWDWRWSMENTYLEHWMLSIKIKDWIFSPKENIIIKSSSSKNFILQDRKAWICKSVSPEYINWWITFSKQWSFLFMIRFLYGWTEDQFYAFFPLNISIKIKRWTNIINVITMTTMLTRKYSINSSSSCFVNIKKWDILYTEVLFLENNDQWASKPNYSWSVDLDIDVVKIS